jgi:hypothetical protein
MVVAGMEALTKLMTVRRTMLILSIGGGYYLACNKKQPGGLLAFAASNQNIFS